jgi:hypothetical protein
VHENTYRTIAIYTKNLRSSELSLIMLGYRMGTFICWNLAIGKILRSYVLEEQTCLSGVQRTSEQICRCMHRNDPHMLRVPSSTAESYLCINDYSASPRDVL